MCHGYRWFSFEKALILYNGTIWFIIKPNFFLTLDDPNLNQALGLKIQPEGMKDLDTKSKNIAINYRLIYRVVNIVNPLSKPLLEVELFEKVSAHTQKFQSKKVNSLRKKDVLFI